jgi:AcrR family transcriptional regulator
MAGSTARSDSSQRPLRADAERNHQLILDAARRAFAEQGLGVRLDEIAEIAGVGVGTVYRRFKNKDGLVSALFEQQVSAIVALADEALTTCEGGTGLRWFLTNTADAMAADRGLQQILTGPHASAERISAVLRAALEARVTELLERALAAGCVRPDVVAGDIPVIQILLGAIIDMTSQVRPELRHRYAQLLLDGLEPHPGNAPLAGPAPTPEEGVRVVETWRPSPRRPGARA